MTDPRPALELSLLDILVILRRRGLWILGATALAVLIAWLLSLVLTPRYQAMASLLPGRSNLVNASIPILERGKIQGGVKFGNLTPRNSQNLEVMASGRLQAMLIDQLDLMDFYGNSELARTDSLLAFESTLRALRRDTHFGLSLQLQVLFVEVHSRDAAMAARITNTYLDLLDTLNLERYRQFAVQKARFLDAQIEALADDIAAAQLRVSRFKRKHGITDFDRERNQVFELTEALRASLLDRQLRLGRLALMAGPESPERIALEAEIAVYEGTLSRLEASMGLDSGSEHLDPIEVEVDLFNLQHQLEQLQMIEDYLIGERESARLQSVIDMSTTTVLDRARPPAEPFWPDRKLMLGLTGGIILLLASLAAIFDALVRQLGSGEFMNGMRRLLKES